MRVDLAFSQRSDFRIKFGNARIEIEEVLARYVRVMRMCETDRQTPWPLVVAARQIIELCFGLIGNFIVIFELVGDFGGTRSGDRTEIVISPVDTFTGLAIIWRPAEIRRVDVGGEPLLETVQLIRTDEMHLAGKRRLVASGAEMRRIGRDFRRKLRSIVRDASSTRQLARHERCTRRGTEGARGVAVGKTGGMFGKLSQIGNMQEFGRAVRKERAVQLIDHEDEDIRLFHCAGPLASVGTRNGGR